MGAIFENGHSVGKYSKTGRKFMERAVELARRGSGRTRPNPIVGAVLVRDGTVVGEGYHHRAGAPHAEIEAIAQAGDQAADSSLYVTLEPCNHVGHTGPCTEAIIAAGITEVFFAARDPASHAGVSGRARLQLAGIPVHEGLCVREASFDNRFFLRAHERTRPWTIAKFASSLDGRIATSRGESQWITGDMARCRAHELRAAVGAVVVGSGTVLADNPRLSVRLKDYEGLQPTRVVLDRRGRIPTSASVLSPADFVREPDRSGLKGALSQTLSRTIMVTTDCAPSAWCSEMRECGAELMQVPADQPTTPLEPPGTHKCTWLHEVSHALFSRGIQSMMVEGGATLLGAYFDAGLIDEVWAFIAPLIIGGREAPGAIGGLGAAMLDDAYRLGDIRIEQLGKDLLVRGIVAHKEVNRSCLQEL